MEDEVKEEEEKELLHKPNQTIMITNGNISAVQRKAYNIILQQAQYELKMNANATSFNFGIADLKRKAGIKATDNWHLKADIEKLADVKIETVHENGDWGFFRLISEAKKNGDLLNIEIPGTIRKALMENSYYTTLDLLTMRNLQGKYAIILYEFAIRYHKVKLPELTIEELRELTGTSEIKSYSNFAMLKKKVLEPAVTEINRETDILLRYEEGEKFKKKVLTVRFYVQKKNKDLLEDEITIESIIPDGSRREQAVELFHMLPVSEQLEGRIERLMEYLELHSYELIRGDIEYCNAKNPKSYWSYFIKSLNSGHFSSDIINQKKLIIQAREKKEREEEEAKERALKLEQEKKDRAEKKYESLSEEEVESYKKKCGYYNIPAKFRETINAKDMILVCMTEEEN